MAVAHIAHSLILCCRICTPRAGRVFNCHAISSAQPNVPEAQVEVNTPEEHMGDVIGDLNSRRGLIGEFIDKPANMKLVKASVPLSEMFQYVSTLRGMTKGALCIGPLRSADSRQSGAEHTMVKFVARLLQGVSMVRTVSLMACPT
jgi:hypothetical protein